MATQYMIAKLTKMGLPVTQDLPDGKWAHSPEYFKHRYSSKATERSDGRTNRTDSVDTEPVEIKIKRSLTVPFATLTRKLTPSERIQLMAMLEAK